MKKIKIIAFSILFIIILSGCSDNKTESSSEAVTVPDFAGERGGIVKDGFIYYQGTDGYYEYDPEDKQSVKTSENSLGSNAVDYGFIVYENNEIIYRDFKGTTLYRQVTEGLDESYYSYFAYDNKLFFGDFIFDVKTGETTRAFEDCNSSYGCYYELSNDYYMRADIGNRIIQRLKLSDMSVDTVTLPEELTYISMFVADLDNDIYISIPDNGKFPVYKLNADGSTEKIGINSLQYYALNDDIYYRDDSSHALMLLSDGKTTQIAENILDFEVADDRFVIYSIYDESNRDEIKYIYDRNDNTTEKLKMFTVEEE